MSRRGDEQRETILAATCAVICRDGIDGVRSTAIAAEAGLTVPLLHYYFPTLDELVLAAYRWDETRFRDAFDDSEPRAFLVESAAGVFELPEPAVRAELRLWLEFIRRGVFDPAVRELVVTRLRRWGAAMEAHLDVADPRASSLRIAAGLGGSAFLLLLDISDVERVAGEVRAGVDAAIALPGPVAVPAVPRWSAPEDDRRTAILDAALRVLGARGLRHTEFRAIAAEAGVSTTLPRYYHPTMHDLHEALLVHGARRDAERLAAATAPFADPRDRVRAALVHGLADADAHAVWTARTELLHLGMVEPDLRALAAAPFRDLTAVLAAELDEARRRGDAVPDLDPQRAALGLAALRQGAATGWLVGALDRDELAQVLLRSVEGALAGQSTPAWGSTRSSSSVTSRVRGE